MPSTAQELRAAAQEFGRIQNFPRVIGVIDCKISFFIRSKIITNTICYDFVDWRYEAQLYLNNACFIFLSTGNHVVIKAPRVEEGLYINRQRFHSLNIQVVCDATKIISYSARYSGIYHNEGVVMYICCLYF